MPDAFQTVADWVRWRGTPLLLETPDYLRRGYLHPLQIPECYFCDDSATIRVEGILYCNAHGTKQLIESLEWWMKGKNRGEER